MEDERFGGGRVAFEEFFDDDHGVGVFFLLEIGAGEGEFEGVRSWGARDEGALCIRVRPLRSGRGRARVSARALCRGRLSGERRTAWRRASRVSSGAGMAVSSVGDNGKMVTQGEWGF